MKLKRIYGLERIVKQILEDDKMAREDDNYLILKVIQETNPEIVGTTFANVMFNAKSNGISFESITRARRKVQSKNPQLADDDTKQFRTLEEKEYMDYALDNHIPRLD